MNQLPARQKLLLSLLALVALLVWGALLLHILIHHDSDSDHCLLCNLAQFCNVSIIPHVLVAFALVGLVSKSETATLVARIATPSIPRSPPSFLSF